MIKISDEALERVIPAFADKIIAWYTDPEPAIVDMRFLGALPAALPFFENRYVYLLFEIETEKTFESEVERDSFLRRTVGNGKSTNLRESPGALDFATLTSHWTSRKKPKGRSVYLLTVVETRQNILNMAGG